MHAGLQMCPWSTSVRFKLACSRTGALAWFRKIMKNILDVDVYRLSCINLHFTVTIDQLNGFKHWHLLFKRVGVSVCFSWGGSVCEWTAIMSQSVPLRCSNRSCDTVSRWHDPLDASPKAWNSNYSITTRPLMWCILWTDELTLLVLIPDYSWSVHWWYWSFSWWHMS